MKGTKNCVVCGSPDVIRHGGHVHKGDEDILSGRCYTCYYSPQLIRDRGREGCMGCDGEWEPKMGEVKLDG